MGPHSKILTGMVFLAVVSGIYAGVSTEFMEPAESGRTVRVMVRKEFKLQPDGSYKEISSDKSPPGGDLEQSDTSAEESAPPPQYAYSPYSYNRGGGSVSDDYDAQGSNQYLQFTADDVQDVMRQLEASSYAVEPVQPSSQKYASYLEANYTGSESAPSPVRTVYYDSKTAPQTYYVDPPRPVVASYANSNYGAPKSIQEILKKPESVHLQRQPATAADTHSNQFYNAPVKQNDIIYSNYDATGPSVGGGDYSYDQGGGYNPGGQSYGVPLKSIPDYGAPAAGPVSDHHNPGWSGDHNSGGGGGYSGAGGVLNSLVNTVSTVGQTGAALSQSLLTTKGHVGSQILHQGGKVVQQAVAQKGETAKVIVGSLSHVPARFSEVLRSKAHLATGFLDSGSRALGSAFSVKASVVNQASNLISATGKASNVVIRAGGNTASKVILAKGKGLASLISGGGAATAALLNHKGNAVAKIAEVLGGLGGAGYSGGGGDGWSNNGGGGGGYEGGLVGGYSENADQYETYNQAPARGYDEVKLQDALKSVVQSPASSYGSPPTGSSEGGQAKLNSAFQSIYNTFKSVQPKQSLFGSYSSPVEVTAKPEESQPSIGQSASSIGESLSKMSKMLNNVASYASAINWLQPKQDKVV